MNPPRGWIWRHATTIKLTADWLTWLAAFPVALWLRLGTFPTEWTLEAVILTVVAAPTIRLCIMEFRLHQQSWGNASLADAERLGLAVAAGTFITFALTLLLDGLLPLTIPRSTPLIAGVLALAAMGGFRLTLRAWVEHRDQGQDRIVVAGTDEAAILFARNLTRSPGMGHVVGFLDDNPTRQGISYLGQPVLGTSHEADQALEGVQEVVISWRPTYRGARRVEAVCHERGIRCRYLADPTELLYGRIQRADANSDGLRDLLHRDAATLDEVGIKGILADKRILVTGAGGSIGSELARQIASYGPEELFLLSHDENSIFELEASLRRRFPGLSVTCLVANVTDRLRIDGLLKTHRPQVVFHAAAHKHVPLMEHHPTEAVRNNVGGTRNMVQAALDHQVERFINISTDKAVNPTNVMGSTKHVAEMLVRWASTQAPDRDFVSVRFGNVLGSRGSVIPTWTQQIQAGGPLTLTHQDMTRYFMLIPEAVQLVLQAGLFGGQGTTYVLDMGDPVRIRDLAEQLIRLHGFVPGKDIEIQVTGLRPGEKLYEELLLDKETARPSPHEKILVEGDLPIPEAFEDQIAALLETAETGDVRPVLQGLVPGADLGLSSAVFVSPPRGS